jgi:transposase-like protein
MIYAATLEEILVRRKAFIPMWRLKHRAVADSLEEAGECLFAFTRLPPSQWRSARATNAIERPHEEFKRRMKTQTVLPSADTATMLFWALLASGQINMRRSAIYSITFFKCQGVVEGLLLQGRAERLTLDYIAPSNAFALARLCFRLIR